MTEYELICFHNTDECIEEIKKHTDEDITISYHDLDHPVLELGGQHIKEGMFIAFPKCKIE